MDGRVDGTVEGRRKNKKSIGRELGVNWIERTMSEKEGGTLSQLGSVDDERKKKNFNWDQFNSASSSSFSFRKS